MSEQEQPARDDRRRVTRRDFVVTGATAALGAVLAACSGGNQAALPSPTPSQAELAQQAASATPAPAATTVPNGTTAESATVAPSATEPPPTATLEPTPQCDDDDDDPTIAQAEGPFFTPDSPERRSLLEAGVTGTTLVVTGRVLGTDCLPIDGALIDFWQADDAGQYDNVGYRLRGHQFTGADGGYRLETILPGLYPGRTRHIHVKVQRAGGAVLTTQLYFPGEPNNQRDGIYNPVLEMAISDTADGVAGAFDFVLS